MALAASVALVNGVSMPAVGFGCAFGNWTGTAEFQGQLPEKAWRATTLALKAGGRYEKKIQNLFCEAADAPRLRSICYYYYYYYYY